MLTQSTTLRRFLTLTTALSMLIPVLPAAAQDASPDASTATPPSRVGEVASITGSASFNGAGSNGQWIAATTNYPVTSGDSLFTQASSQAALAVDSSRITLSDSTELQITSIDQNTVAATQSQGEIFLALSYLQPGQNFVITTPRGTVTMSQNGNYDIQAGDQNDPTIVTVLAGAATVTDPGATLQVQANEAGVLTGTDQTTAQIGAAQQDAFITQMLAQNAPPPPSYAPPVVQQMTGVSQLSNYGSWNQSTQYGAVWYPQVSSDWTPYREGHWAYVAPWGYTWVESEPWGFAPFHYGRWVDDDNRWGWAPAPDYSEGGGYGGGYGGGGYYQPVYAPAVVSFFGAGIGVGLSVGLTLGALNSGNVGWVPLAPEEPFYPYYHASPTYIQNINRVNVRNYTNIHNTNIYNTTVNKTVVNNYYGGLKNRRAATYLPADAMSRGEPVSRYGKPAPDTMLASARPVGPEGFRPTPGEQGHNGPLALPPPNFQHRMAPAPQPSAFAQRRTLPPAIISHQPAVAGPNGMGFAHPNAGQPLPNAMHPGFGGQTGVEPGMAHPGFATMPGYHAPPPPPGSAPGGTFGGQHAMQPMGTPGFHPGEPTHPGMNAPLPAANHPGFATEPGYHAPPPPPGGAPGGEHAMQPMGAQGGMTHPQNLPHVITPQQYHPEPTAPAYHPPVEQYHPTVQQYHPQPAPQVYHPPVEQYHPPVQQYHPPVEQYHPPVEQYHPPVQQFHPAPQPAFHPQPAPQPQPHPENKKN